VNFYNLSFSGVQIRIWTCINNILRKSHKTGNEELGYWWANFYNLSFNGVKIRIWTCINNTLRILFVERVFWGVLQLVAG
jgi:hypothetical protein